MSSSQHTYRSFFILVMTFYVSVCNTMSQSITEIPNLLIWLRADSGVVVTAGEVTQWSDISGNNHHFYPVLSTTQPTLVTTSPLNNEPFILFNGTKRMQNLTNLSLSNATIIVVAENNTGDPTYGRTIDHTYNNGFWIGRGGSTDLGGGFYEGAAPYGNFVAMPLNSPYAISMVRNNGVTASYSGSEPFPVPTRTTFAASTSPNRIMLGASVLGGDNGNKDIYEVIIFIRDLSVNELTQVHNYLRNKYASSVSLGPDIAITDSFCATTLTATAGYSNYLWSTGETSSSVNVVQSGTYWVRAKGPLGFYSYDTIQVSFPPIPVPVNNSICADSFHTWNADMGPGFTYLWSTGATTPSIDISTPGTYNVTVYDSFGCSKNSGDFTFTIDNYPNTSTLGADSIMCSGNTIALQVGAGETVDYFWNGDVSTGQAAFWVVDTTGNYFLESVNVNGCVARDTIGVTIIGTAPVVDFALANFCHLDAMTATDLSTAAGADPILNWSWDFGDGNLSSAQNALNTYLVPGTYTVELYVEAQSGCAEFKSESIDIRALPTASFTSSGACDNALTQFSDLSVQGDGTINGWFWNFGQPGGIGPNTSVIQDPSKDYGAPGIFDVYLQITDDYGCQDDTTVSITINEAPQTQFTLGSACENLPITITNTSSIGSPNTIQNYLWDFGDGTFSILPTPSKTFPNFGWQTITLTSTANNGCTDIEQQQVLIHAIPLQNFVHGPACVGSYTELSDQSVVATGNVAQTSWELDLVDNLQGTIAYYSFTSEGSHNVEMTTISDFGCAATAMYIFNVGPELSAEWSSSPTTIVAGVPVQFSYEGTGAGYWDWDLGNGEHSFFTNPLYTYSEDWADSTINVSLYVTNADGCEDTVTYTYSIERATYDLAVEQIYLNESNGFMNVGVRLHNQGTSLIDSVDVVLKFKNGFSIMERYPQVLQSGESVIMVFDALSNAFVSVQDNEQDWICAEGIPYTYLNLTEDDLENNLTCLNREGELPVLIGPNPNPAMDHFDFEMLITTESTIDLSMIDARGRLVKHFAINQNYSPGLYSFYVPLETVESGVYFLRLISGETKILRKLLVANY
ncbi:MAG: PKD domain-containing protein [Bacteroidetes bacterium]|nr:MAG: PKD domain-containing protein [Bacteroidota bacterium]